jgi:hypothetical protein
MKLEWFNDGNQWNVVGVAPTKMDSVKMSKPKGDVCFTPWLSF